MTAESDRTGRARDTVRIFSTLGDALQVIGRHFGAYLLAVVVMQGLVVLAIVPFMARLLDLLLTSTGQSSLTTLDVLDVIANPVADLMLLTIALLGSFAVYLELSTLLVIAHRHYRGHAVTPRAVLSDLQTATSKLLLPSSLLLIPYFFVVLPLGNIGLGAVLTQGIRVPSFISGELLKSTSGTWLYFGVLVVILYLNVRLVFTLSVFVSSESSVLQSMVASWRMTRWMSWRILVLFGSVVGIAVLLIAGTYTVGLMPTRYTDQAFPEWSPIVAGVSVALMQFAVFAITGFAAAMLANVLVDAQGVRRYRAKGVRFTPRQVPLGHEPLPFRMPRVIKVTGPIAAVLIFAGLSVANTAGMLTLAADDRTMVIAHRGLIAGGVENTIPALEAAAAVEPDYVEIDIQETRDGQFVVMHDTNLSRLAGIDRQVGSMTLAELEAVTLRQGGFTASIPSLDDFIDRAKELGVPLLVELKPRGDESPDYLTHFIETMREHGVVDEYLVHSLSKSTIEDLKRRAPDFRVGYIVPVNIGHAPITSADFIVMEESSYSRALRDETWAEGLEIYVWTVNDTQAMRTYLREDVDALITDHPDVAKRQRTEIAEDTSLVSRLEDFARRLFGW
jgi:glycerophosphoryl diester phosphodiesterase